MTMDFLTTYDRRRNRGLMHYSANEDVLMAIYRIWIILFSYAGIRARDERGDRTHHNI